MGKIILTLCFFTTMLFFAQEKKTVVEFSKNDSIEILKMNNYIYIMKKILNIIKLNKKYNCLGIKYYVKDTKMNSMYL